ncbi:MAG: hypothetical protein M1819_005083 [Sarea resinae]|nr:MAG: hypothetical protein M1819_005083 [Sarea resinae]
MAPNLYLLTQAVFTPSRWFSSKPQEKKTKASRRKEHWDEPVPGTYEYIPGRGWYLIARDSGEDTDREPVVHSKVLRRYILKSEVHDRTRWATVETTPGKRDRVRFFQLDDGVTWYKCWNAEGVMLPKPWEKWELDPKTQKFHRLEAGSIGQEATVERVS